MKISAIIAEYNPFHKGHEHHIKQTRKLTDADAVAVIMSGSFVQRGSCAICDKWTRANAAVSGGADLVFELPVYYSLGTAQLFANGAISTLNSLGCIDFLSFGAESGDISVLTDIAKKLLNEREAIERETQKHLTFRNGYPYARAKALSSLYGIDETLFSSPNNMLALEYLQALYLSESSITPIAVKRIGGDYHDTSTSVPFPSAAAIRAAISEGKDISDTMPENVYKLYNNACKNGIFPIFPHDFDCMLLSRLRACTPAELKDIIAMPQGFESRIIAAAKKSASLGELIELCSARQYTHSRIRRLIFASFLGIKDMGYSKPASYARVLAMNNRGKAALAEMQKSTSIPIITKTADYIGKDTDPLFLLDVRASDMYALACHVPEYRRGGKDFTTSPIIVNE